MTKVTSFSFFRSQSNPSILREAKKSQRKSFNSKPARPSLSSASSSNSSLHAEERSAKMPDSHKRLSFPSLMHSPKSSTRSISQHQSATLEAVIESPPLVFYGSEFSSTGALLSGLLKITINEDALPVESIYMQLACEVTRKKPFHAHCPECMNQSQKLEDWNFITGPAPLQKGQREFPFSHLLKGHLPPSMKGSLATVDYVLKGKMVPKTGEPITFSHNLIVKRAICPSDQPRHSVRIFPPTTLTANCQLPPVIHPIGETTVAMRIDGIVKRNNDAKTLTQWRLKRLTWRLDETQKVISPACVKHAAKAGPPNADGTNKGTPHQDTRTIGTEEIKTGWKSDYSTQDGLIEMEFPFSINADSKPICDMKAKDGTEVSHVLVVEMIVAEEFAPITRPNQITPTGSARVLRMHFNVILTERAGMGISWDEEQPPLYENVPENPPAYGKSEIYEGEPIPDYEDLEPLDPSHNETPPATSHGERSSQDNGESSSRAS